MSKRERGSKRSREGMRERGSKRGSEGVRNSGGLDIDAVEATEEVQKEQERVTG